MCLNQSADTYITIWYFCLVILEFVCAGRKSHQCEKCGKRFAQSSTLTKHKLVHKGKKSYLCDKCGKIFTRKNDFKKHELTHTGEKPYQCTECGKRFTRRSNLAKHEFTHTGEKLTSVQSRTLAISFLIVRGNSTNGTIVNRYYCYSISAGNNKLLQHWLLVKTLPSVV